MSLLWLDHVSLSLPGSKKTLLHDINYNIEPQDFIILLGANGSGKSTLLKLLQRDYVPTRGEIKLANKRLSHYSNKNFGRLVMTLTQNTAESLFNSLSVYENYLLIKEDFHFIHKNSVKDRTFLANYLNEYHAQLPNKLDQLVGELSGGEKQSLVLALCLLKPPLLLLLDEHTSALDPKSSAKIMQLTQAMITRHKVTCILTTHDLNIALNYGNKIIHLQEGSIYRCYDAREKAEVTKETLLSGYIV